MAGGSGQGWQALSTGLWWQRGSCPRAGSVAYEPLLTSIFLNPKPWTFRIDQLVVFKYDESA